MHRIFDGGGNIFLRPEGKRVARRNPLALPPATVAIARQRRRKLRCLSPPCSSCLGGRDGLFSTAEARRAQSGENDLFRHGGGLLGSSPAVAARAFRGLREIRGFYGSC